ncbi:MAG: hypothetical protein JTT11_03430 [Candidatus Brockarchaeota archaeon]|nr:hypothetical protein [Candidatus Brockarchaeota archaeon]
MPWYMSKYPGRIRTYDETMNLSIERRDELVEYCQEFVTDTVDASLDGIHVRLYTNMPHVKLFYGLNWWPTDPSRIPHGQVYAIDDGGKITTERFYEKKVAKPEVNAGAAYNSETKTLIVFNNDYYGEVKPGTLSIAADIFEDQFGVLSVHGASAAIDGKGYLLIGPTNAGKTTHSYGPAIEHPRGEFHQDDWIFVHFGSGKAMGHASERWFYMRTNAVQNYPWLEPIFRRCELENVRSDDPLEKFLPSEPRVMVDPRRILRPEKVVDEIRIYNCFLLKRDPKDSMVIRSMEPEEAVEFLSAAPEKWYNNYLTTFGERKAKRRGELFGRLFKIAPPYLLNIVAPVEKVRSLIFQVLKD